jgi:hypothetical protein
MSVDTLPPIIIAAVAMAAGSAWQCAGTVVMLHALPRSLAPGWRIALAWFLWLPVSGAVVLGLCLAHVAGRAPLALGSGLVVVIALVSPNRRFLLDAAKKAIHSVLNDTRRWERWLLVGGFAILGLNFLYAAHPQRIYDQLNYHLVVADLIVREGNPFSGAWDVFVLFTGVVEYGFAWHRSWTESGLLFIALTQVAVFVATIPPIILAGMLIARPTPRLLGLLSTALPGVVPEGTILRMAKPDALMVVGVIIGLGMLIAGEPIGFIGLLGIGALLLSCKLTAVHAAIGLAAAAVFLRPRAPPSKREWVAFLALAFGAVALQLTKNALFLGNPLYPAADKLFPSWASDARTADYWHGIAFDAQPRIAGLLGPFFFAWRAWALVGMVAVSTAAIAWTRCRGNIGDPPPPLRGTWAFLASYSLAWPLFWGARIFARFVSPFAGGLLVLLASLLARLDVRNRRMIEVLCLCFAIPVCGVGWSAINIVRWNAHSAEDAYALQWPRLRTARALQPLLSSSDTVVADAPEKFFFHAKLLYEEPLSPRERAVLDELGRDPIRVAAKYQVTAFIISASQPMSPRIHAIWDALQSRGQVMSMGPDRVLFSACHFQPGC